MVGKCVNHVGEVLIGLGLIDLFIKKCLLTARKLRIKKLTIKIGRASTLMHIKALVVQWIGRGASTS